MSIAQKRNNECCGCNACAEICPKQCISMYNDKLGFSYPKVDLSTCIECGKCERVCPLIDPESILSTPISAFASWNKNLEIHSTSASGGIGYALSQYIIENGGIVYGCASIGTKAKHIRIDKIEDLHQLQGSKYVQSDIQGIFQQIKSDLSANRKVLFIGTPCQAAAVKKFIEKKNENLIIVDLICHGVPSQQMLDNHILKIAKGEQVKRVTFRDGNSYKFALTLYNNNNNNNIYSKDYWQDPLSEKYYHAFMCGVSYRPSCSECHFAKSKRVSDLTIGDFWGFKDSDKLPKETQNGLSVILVNSEVGYNVIKNLHDKINIIQRPIQEAVEGNTQLRHPAYATKRTRIFRQLYPLLPFDTAVTLSYCDRFARRIAGKIIRNVIRR